MNVKALDRTKLVLAGLGVLSVVVALVGFLMVVNPQRAKVASLDGQIATQQFELAGMHASGAASKPDLRAAELFQLSRALPDTVDQPGILLTLAQLAQRAHVALAGVQPQAPTTLPDGASDVPLTVVVNGSWTHLTSFLANLRAQVRTQGGRFSVAGRLFNVSQIQMATSGASADSGSIQATLHVDAFAYGAPPAPAPPTTTTTAPTTSGSQQALGSGAS